MEYIFILIGCLITIAILYLALGVNIKKVKELAKNEKLNELVNRFPENEEICKSLYVAISDTIFIANIKDTYTRIQTIAHECIHSTQSKRMLLFNFYYSNIYLLYFVISIILTICKVFTNYNLQIIILLLMSLIYYIIRSFLETDAMTRARYIAEDYMKEYIKENKIANIEEILELTNTYDKINKIGIPTYNFLLINSSIIKVIIYILIVIIMLLF